MNSIQLAQIMGHSSLTMIQAVYIHLSTVDAYEAMLQTCTALSDRPRHSSTRTRA